MRKLFRFKYEPCAGTCYHWCDALPEELNKINEADRRLIVTLMVEAHAKLCDNPDYSFGIDRQDVTGMFVAHFRTPEQTDTFLNPNFSESVQAVCKVVLAANIPVINGACGFGEHGSEDLGKEILKACTDIAYREEHHNNCPCVVVK